MSKIPNYSPKYTLIYNFAQAMGKKILLIEHTAAEFVISRLQLGLFLQKKGHEVYALLPENDVTNQHDKIREKGIHVLTYPYDRNTGNPLSNFKSILLFRRLFKTHKFDLIHSFKFQPNFYAALGKLFLKNTKLVLHITGLGVAFTDKKIFKIRLLRFVSRCFFLLNFMIADKLIFQNPDDENDLWLTHFFRKKHCVIEGSGVDIQRFDKRNFDIEKIKGELGLESKIVLTFISRLVWQKGIREAIEASERIFNEFPLIHLLIVGKIDYENPESVSENFIKKYESHPQISFLGLRSDISEILAATDVYVYPSYYREGVPRTVLEALATGVPVITTDMPGCRLTVEHEKNGYLIAPKSVDETEQILRKILVRKNLKKMGEYSRKLAEERFQNQIVYEKIYEKYLEII